MPPIIAELPWFFSHVFPWPLMFVGCGLVYDAARTLLRARQSHQWPTVEGKVTHATITLRESGEDVSFLTYIPVIEYRYTVKDESQTSRKIALAERNAGTETEAKALLKRYAVGRAVRMYYSPQDSNLAVLEPGVRWPMFGKLVGGLFFLAAGVAALWFFNLAPTTLR